MLMCGLAFGAYQLETVMSVVGSIVVLVVGGFHLVPVVVGSGEKFGWSRRLSIGFKDLESAIDTDQINQDIFDLVLGCINVSDSSPLMVDCCVENLVTDGSNFVFDPGGYRGDFRVFFGDFSPAGCVRFDASGLRGVVIVNGFWCISRGFV